MMKNRNYIFAAFVALSAPLHAQHIGGEVYGGGHDGKVEGTTSVDVTAGDIGKDNWVGTPYGGVFGGGEGDNAIVTGKTTVNVSGGEIRNSVYGGGKRGNVNGDANVEITGGTIKASVYGGARMADIDGYTYVYVHDDAKTTVSPVLGAVYGGNDIAGNVNNSKRESPQFYKDLPMDSDEKPDVTPTTFLRIGMTNVAHQPYIGVVYGGSDGGYTYVGNGSRFDVTLPKDRYNAEAGTEVVNVSTKPILDRTFIHYDGGTVGNMFAGGDNVTVTDRADIHLHSDQTLAAATIPLSYVKGTNAFIKEFDAEPVSYTENGTNAVFQYQINRVFGGNNRAAMSIRPNWHLHSAHVNNLYAGGNKGEMTYPNGIYITVSDNKYDTSGSNYMVAHNVFGGCRLADVHPSSGTITTETIDGFNFPAGYAARVLILGGKVYNVYGGNDVSGQVYQGAYVAIRSNIIENVYGSGNGSYAYYSSDDYRESDFYFQTNGRVGVEALKALNAHRPNTENVLIDLAGTSTKTTFIAGNVFCGGNSATLRDLTGNLEYARARIKMGSYVTVNGVFLGSNGDQMLTDDIIVGMNDPQYNPDINLTNHDQMVEYMRGVEVAIKPDVIFEEDYVPYSTYIGSFFCGGNKGSMTAAGTFNVDFLKSIRIFDKLVAGSNDANVQEKTDNLKADGTENSYANHSYVLGGLTSEAHPKVKLALKGLQLEPKKITYDAQAGTFSFDWNRYTDADGDMAIYAGFMHGANIYGGCYSSGYVNGDVEIDISESLLTTETYMEMQKLPEGGYGNNPFDWDHHVSEPFISTITCFGGGYGEETEIWGNTTVNLTDYGHLMKIRGGGEKGWVGKMLRDEHGKLIDDDEANKYKAYYYSDSTKYALIAKKKVEQAYGTTVHLNAELLVDPTYGTVFNNVAELTAGGFAGIVTGNTKAIVDNGCVYRVFGGASNAHIYGSSETLIGQNGFPYVTQTVYGGNDFGGQIMGTSIHETRNENDGSIQKVKSNTYVEYFSGEVGYGKGEVSVPDTVSADFGIFGGGYGFYDYRTKDGNKYYGRCVSQPNLLSKIEINNVGGVKEADFAANTFVNISSKTTNAADKVMRIYGGGQGYPGQMGFACTRQTYVLFNAANANARPNYLAQYVFGAGDCARTWYSRLDAYAGNAKYLFGACRGVSYNQNVDELGVKSNPGAIKARGGDSGHKTAGIIQDLTYMGELSETNVYPSLEAPAMDIFTSGAFSGTKHTKLTLFGGHVNDVYGSTIEEGITYLTEVNVPKGSTLRCNAIFGGGKGLYKDRPCDTFITSVNFHSEDATVEEAIYGGNCDYRFTRRTTIDIDVPVRNSLGELVNVYGGGKGENTISEITFITLEDGAQVKNVFGGGCDGQVYNKPTVIKYLLTEDYFKDKYTDGDAGHSYYLGDVETQGFNVWKNLDHIKDISLYAKSTTPMTIGTLAPLSMGYSSEVYNNNTEILIHEGAVVTENAYGAGYGTDAKTAGGTLVKLLGGTVQGNIYGGGYGGNVEDALAISGTKFAKMENNVVMNNRTEVYLNGGTCTNAYGSGLDGDVIGDAYTYLGREVCDDDTPVSYLDGDPAIQRSLYGGGENGRVEGTAYLNIYSGHVGYKYDADAADYVANIDYLVPADSILYDNGNAFGGGYGEDAKTYKSAVTMTGGIIRNSLYGGGEIATIGDGKVKKTSDAEPPTIQSIDYAGEAHVYMYGGHVLRDVFGGGRGYSYDLKGNEVTGAKFYTDGYVFGKTDVNIYRGEIGTGDQASLDRGYGNVFGGGNVGFVYSGTGIKRTADSDATHTKGYYYDASGNLTEDCRVVVSPYCKVIGSEVTIDSKKYTKCSYVPTDALNKLLGKASSDQANWDKLDYDVGVMIHNAVFAGGNVTRGDSKLSADINTVFGNATATLNDVYHRDLITVGTEHVGGLYGDGNLTKVDGYKEICIANYGTDYYGMKQEITQEEYYQLNDRERAYFQLMYKCINAYEPYTEGTQITEEVYKNLKEEEKGNWQLAGFCTVYAGRLLNTIQRADFVGVHGSRIVLQGAQDRTVDVVDYMDYAINRVGEVSLNQRKATTGETGTESSHGNYFGMYSVVNYLKALTSDVDMYNATRTTESTQHPVEPAYPTYFAYKEHYQDKAYRNNASSPNQIALASGVYLEIVDHKAPEGGETVDGVQYNEGDKVYGPVTGVIELQLINIGSDMGGAFVYAKNIHGKRSGTMLEQAIVSQYNKGARTKRGYSYDQSKDNSLETSGNFVHSAKQIIDDCYPSSADHDAPAHYWFLRGTVYVYDQYISAFTGSSTAYKADVQIPLTITAGSHGQLKVLTVQPNLYAYYKDYTDETHNTKLPMDDKMVVNGKTYQLNDIITYWDWVNLGPAQQKLFIHDTYMALQDFSYDKGGTTVNVSKNDAMTLSDYNALPDNVTVIEEGAPVVVSKDKAVHISNGMKHTTGYALTADIGNPVEWSDRYIETDGTNIITAKEYKALSDEDKKLYFQGPSYKSVRGVYGQSDYTVGNIVSAEIVADYSHIPSELMPDNQATMEETYISIATVSYNYNGNDKTLEAGVGISKTEYDEAVKVAGNADKFNRAYVCNTTITIGDRYIINGDLISQTYYNSLSADNQTVFSQAYICTQKGRYGGTLYESKNYDALRAWCDLSKEDRDNFTFNYDAFDLFLNNLDPNAEISAFDKPGDDYYSRGLPIEYTAIALENVSYTDQGGISKSYTVGDSLDRAVYEKVPNEKIHYALVTAGEGQNLNVVKNAFYIGEQYYTVGTMIKESVFSTFTEEQKANVMVFSGLEQGNYYFCRESYTVNESGEGKPVTNVSGTAKTYNSGETVPVGTLIKNTNYNELPNLQLKFRVTGVCPTETSTLYVARDANVNDVLKDRVVTVVYQYQYEESTVDGSEVNLVTEKHVLNIHLEFRPGAPSVGRLKVPGAVIPGTTVGLKQPSVTKGAYEIIGGGWELYDNLADASNHINGQPYVNNASLVYFYQNGQYVAYYAKTFTGKTYSNPVQFTVANYHSINDVMADTEHHMYIDHEKVPRNPKIYIDNDDDKTNPEKSELDLLKDLYDLSNGGLTGHSPLKEKVKNCSTLDFILQDDVTPKKYTDWTPLGNDNASCFGGNGFFHGDGHTVYGLNNPLFGNVCAEIYNLGVKGTFTGSGLANYGQYAANCWAMSDGAHAAGTKPIFGNEGTGSTIDNCYYYEADDAATKYTAGNAIRKTWEAFNNGEVAFDLNKYYLLKRYNDNNAPSGDKPNPYSYYTVKGDNTLQLHKDAGWYTDDDARIEVTYTDNNDQVQTKNMNYTEFRFFDGDFVNADGQIHTVADERLDDGYYYPIYPDDYLFFGQHLNYGFVDGVAHDSIPGAVRKTDANRILVDNNTSNRVYRAIGYYGSMDKHETHFNVDCVVPDFYYHPIESKTTVVVKTPEKDGITITFSGTNIETETEDLANGKQKTTVITTNDDVTTQKRTITTVVTISEKKNVYPNMTGLDFTGGDDYAYAKGLNDDGVFYAPIADYRTLIDFANPNQSRNMLVYAEASDTKGYKVLSDYLIEPKLEFTNDTYKNIPKITDAQSSSVQGHLVKKTLAGSYVTDRDHFLVDENNFHCPIAFNMGAANRMWYQRIPCTFVDETRGGYESIILPFDVELVSAHQKGELTHFYDNDKANHEYWLRGFQGVKEGKIQFIRPMNDTTSEGYDERYASTGEYSVANDFLYDYYYNNSTGKDGNQDIYQKYYKDAREYDNYIYITANIPYILAFPGTKYYEFDMSGEFVPQNTFATINKLDKQSVSFCSGEGASISPIQSGEMKTTKDGYTFEGIFQKTDVTSDASVRILTTNGDKFATRDKIYLDKPEGEQALTVMQPFHAFLKGSGSGAKEIFIGEDASYITDANENAGELEITTRDRAIFVTSHMSDTVYLQIVNAAGQLVATLSVAPGRTESHEVPSAGVYMVNNHKILVK